MGGSHNYFVLSFQKERRVEMGRAAIVILFCRLQRERRVERMGGSHSYFVLSFQKERRAEMGRAAIVILFCRLQRERRVERMGGSHCSLVMSSPERKESGKDGGQLWFSCYVLSRKKGEGKWGRR
jgi:hypothetical protein